MKKTAFKKISLDKGEMFVYDFGAVKLHAYKTNDFIDDEVFVVEKAGKGVIIESPCFFDNNLELEEYLLRQEIQPAGLLLAYHMGGGTFLKGCPKWATKNADDYGHTGGGKALIDNFTKAFGDVFDGTIHTVTDYLEEGEATIGGIRFIITRTPDAFDIEIPEINTVYTHMLGHDCHSIVAGSGHADVTIAALEGYLEKGYDLILTSHYTPEDLKDAQTKIAYLQNLKAIAAESNDADSFKTAVKEAYPAYSGENYLDMTAGFFFS